MMGSNGNVLQCGSLRYRVGGLIFWGAYTWRCLFSEFYGIQYCRITKFRQEKDFFLFRKNFHDLYVLIS